MEPRKKVKKGFVESTSRDVAAVPLPVALLVLLLLFVMLLVLSFDDAAGGNWGFFFLRPELAPAAGGKAYTRRAGASRSIMRRLGLLA